MTDASDRPVAPRYRRLLPALAILLALVVLATAALTIRSLSRLVSAHEAVNRVHAVGGTLHSLLSGVLDARTGQRNYLISRRTDHLAPYFSALDQVVSARARLDEALADDAWAREHLDDLDSAIEDKLSLLGRGIALTAEERHEEAREMVVTDAGSEEMEALRGTITRLGDEARLIHELRSEQHAIEVRNTYATLLGSFALNLALLGALFILMRRSDAEQRASAAAMHERNRELSVLLARTAHSRQQSDALAELSGFLQTCSDMREATDQMRLRLPPLVSADNGALYLFAPSRNQLHRSFAWGETDFVDSLIPSECWGLRQGQPFRQPDGAGADTCRHLHELSASRRRSLECLPMVAHGELMGLLVIDQCAECDPDTESARRAVLEHLALSLGNIALRESLRQQSIRDPLTGLYNRRFLEESAERELLRAERQQVGGNPKSIAVMMIDVDHFKTFNDEHGHDAGDRVLREVARVLQQFTRGSDVAARYGGEEFTLFLPDIDAEHAAARAEELRRAIEAMTVTGTLTELATPVTVSIGLAYHPADGTTFGALLATADACLYAAKHAGRNRVIDPRSADTHRV